MRFTTSDSPALTQRIQRDLDLVVARVREADPHLRALVLTGGFARGEGAVRGGEPQNDYDLVAVRGMGRPKTPYTTIRAGLEEALRIHIDLAPVAAMRIPWVPASIFWYETALRGRVLWGDDDTLQRVRIRRPLQIDRREGMRLLVNRAAGLVFATEQDDDGRRLQSSKALLGVMDAWMLSQGVFPPTHAERCQAFQALLDNDAVPGRLAALSPWFEWAFKFKTQPDKARRKDGSQAWETAANAVLDAVPDALAHAGVQDLDAYGRQDSIIDHLHYLRSVTRGAKPLRHPTSRVRVATLRMLKSCLDSRDAGPWLADLAGRGADPLPALESLRTATLQ